MRTQGPQQTVFSRRSEKSQSKSSFGETLKSQTSIGNYSLRRKAELEEKLIESGEKIRLEDYLKKKFIEVGWKNDLKNFAKEYIIEKGNQIISEDELYKLLQQKGKETVPIKLREDIVSRLVEFVEEQELDEIEDDFDDDA